MDLDHIAGRPGLIRDDGRIPLGQCVEQRRLPRIRRPGNHHPDPVAQNLAAAIPQMHLHGRDQRHHDRPRHLAGLLRHILFVGEVQTGLHEALHLQKLGAPTLIETPQRPFRLSQGLTGLGLRFSCDKIRQALNLGQVEFPVLERPPGELPRLGKTRAADFQNPVDHSLDHGAAAMDLKLGHVLASEAGRGRKPQHEAPVDPANSPQSRPAGIGHAARHGLQDRPCHRSRDPNDRHGPNARPRRGRHDRVISVCFARHRVIESLVP